MQVQSGGQYLAERPMHAQPQHAQPQSASGRPSWHSEADAQTRNHVLQLMCVENSSLCPNSVDFLLVSLLPLPTSSYQIFSKRRPGVQQPWSNRLPDFIRRLEDALYRVARSKVCLLVCDKIGSRAAPCEACVLPAGGVHGHADPGGSPAGCGKEICEPTGKWPDWPRLGSQWPHG